jgi:hypothetical protein
MTRIPRAGAEQLLLFPEDDERISLPEEVVEKVIGPLAELLSEAAGLETDREGDGNDHEDHI